MKIAIVGNAGSGKSTLALELHERLGLPLYHLDQYFWKPGWKEPDRTTFEIAHNALCDNDQWIIEGMAIRFAEYRFECANVIIFIDIPRYMSFYRVFRRAWKHLGTEQFAAAPGCPERGPSMRFLRFIWQFKKKQRMQIQAFFMRYAEHKNLYMIKNEKDKAHVVEDVCQLFLKKQG